MSSFWSILVSVITLGTILGCFLLLRWCLKNKTGVEEGDDMHHDFDGIVEINNGLPVWWTYMFYAVIVWALVYLLLYPGLGNFAGVLGWTSSNQGVLTLEESRQATEENRAAGKIVQYDRERDFAAERFDPVFAAIAARPVEDLLQDPEALQVGQRLYLQNCAMCHGSDARGATGFPNLTDDAWLYGGSFEKIKETLHLGRMGVMPGWLDAMGESGIEEVVEYTLSLSGRQVNQSLAERGKARFAACAACHGVDGKGNQALGAPDLTDTYWLYGGSKRAVTETLNYGRNGVMPAFEERLGAEKIHVISAYVYSLSNKQ